MQEIQKVVLNPVTDSIIFVGVDQVTAFPYSFFIHDKQVERVSPYEQFLAEFAVSSRFDDAAKPDPVFMNQSVSGYITQTLDEYESEINHESAVVVYTLENGFGTQ